MMQLIVSVIPAILDRSTLCRHDVSLMRLVDPGSMDLIGKNKHVTLML